MSELQEWLRARGLEAIGSLLADNDIALDILPDLTDQDLERLGLSLGQRRRLLKAIASLSGERKAAAPQTVPIAPIASVDDGPGARREAERRQVTVLFCDLVASTELSGRLDPEDLSKLIRGYQDACAGAVARFSGFLAKLMGDGVLAYFGFPQAHEDSAEQAIRAALAIIAAIPALTTPNGPRLQTRIGINDHQGTEQPGRDVIGAEACGEIAENRNLCEAQLIADQVGQGAEQDFRRRIAQLAVGCHSGEGPGLADKANHQVAEFPDGAVRPALFRRIITGQGSHWSLGIGSEMTHFGSCL